MPYFLTQDQIYRVLQRELPPGVYPDGLPQNFLSTSDMYAVAKEIADAYVNLQGIYLNYWPETTDDRLADWEIKVFGVVADSTLTNQNRINRLLAKIRSLQGISIADMIAVVNTVVPAGTLVEIREWGNYTGGWMIGLSQLGIETFLNSARMVDDTGPNICCPPGSPPANLAAMQTQAYTYEVLIYGYTLSATQRANLDLALSAAEPARSAHVITDGLDPANAIGGNT